MQCHCRLGVLVICIPAVLVCAVHIVCNPFRPSPLRKLNAIQDITQCATTGTPPRRAAGVIRRCEALGTTKPHPIRVASLSREDPTTASAKVLLQWAESHLLEVPPCHTR